MTIYVLNKDLFRNSSKVEGKDKNDYNSCIRGLSR